MTDDMAWDAMMAGLDERLEAPLGDNAGTARLCSAYLEDDGEEMCRRPATHHIIWGGEGELETSFACDAHVADAIAHYKTLGTHAPEAACAMPGACYVLDLNLCVPKEGLLSAIAEQKEIQAIFDLDRMDTTGA